MSGVTPCPELPQFTLPLDDRDYQGRAVATSFQVVRLGGARTKCGYNNDIHDRPFRAHPQMRALSSKLQRQYMVSTVPLRTRITFPSMTLGRVARAARLKKWYGHGRSRTGA